MNLESFETIEKYLAGDLNSQELNSFEKELKSNPNLQKEVELHKLTNNVVVEGRLLDVRSKLVSIHGKGTVAKSFGNLKMIAVSALSVLAISTGGYFFYQDSLKAQEVVVPSQDGTTQSSNQDDVIVSEVATQKKEAKSTIELEKIENDIVEEASSEVVEAENKKVIPTKAEPKPIVVDVCQTVQIGTELDVIHTCVGAERGGVLVNTTQTYGGKAPYSYSIDGQVFDTAGIFTRLGKGTYSFYIKDANGCIVKKNNWVRIKSTSCK